MLKACHSSGKLARWSQTIAEFDVSIDLEGNAQMLMPCSEVPLNQLVNLWEISAKYQWRHGRTVTVRSKTKLYDPVYIENDLLPSDEKLAKKIVLKHPCFILIDKVLFCVDSMRENNLRIAVPASAKQKLMEEAHAGSMADHVAPSLSKRYWWEWMYSDVRAHGCLTCAAYGGTGCWQKAPLKSIPVSSPLERVGNDIVQMPQTEYGNRYVIVLWTTWPNGSRPMADLEGGGFLGFGPWNPPLGWL